MFLVLSSVSSRHAQDECLREEKQRFKAFKENVSARKANIFIALISIPLNERWK
jgi:hypothetical protein